MADYRDSYERRDRRSRSRSRSPKRYGRNERLYNRDERRKRNRSGSRDFPRKRRSLSPRRSSGMGRDRDERQRPPRYESERDERRKKPRRGRSKSGSPPLRKQQRSPELFKRSKIPLPSQNDAFHNEDGAVVKADPPVEKQKPNFGTTGRLAAASNTIQTGGQSIVLKYHEPAEARKPSTRERWRMYVFKGDDIVDTIELAEQSCWLFGREAAVVDVLIEHPSCSKQHAVIQFRYIEKRNEFGDKLGKVRPYLLDLESANNTLVNDNAVPEAKYVELRDKDAIKFGHSSREYVMQLPPAQ